jgi:hypothetical protein
MTTPPDLMLEHYLDGELSAADRRALEASLEQDAARREAVDAQRAIDSALRRSLAPPSADAMRARLELARPDDAPELRLSGDFSGPPSRPATRPRATWRRVAAVAAAIVLAVVGTWQGITALRPATPGGYGPFRSLDAIYAEAEGGTLDVWECRDDQEFAETFRGHYGQPLVLRDLPDGVAALGLAYRNSLSPRSTCLLATIENEPVIVVIDRIERAAGGRLAPDSTLHLHSRRIDGLVLFEISRRDQAILLQHLAVPGRSDVQ